MKIYKFRTQDVLFAWQRFYPILCTLNRRRELNRLIGWATRKRLTHPLSLYRLRLADEERRLFRYRLAHPRLTAFAYSLHLLAYVFFPVPRYLEKGSASAYRSQRIA
jgi:hypothetical protein